MSDTQVTELAGEVAVDTIIGLVKTMKLPAVVTKLMSDYGLTIEGDGNAKRRALTMAMLRTHLVEVGV